MEILTSLGLRGNLITYFPHVMVLFIRNSKRWKSKQTIDLSLTLESELVLTYVLVKPVSVQWVHVFDKLSLVTCFLIRVPVYNLHLILLMFFRARNELLRTHKIRVVLLVGELKKYPASNTCE